MPSLQGPGCALKSSPVRTRCAPLRCGFRFLPFRAVLSGPPTCITAKGTQRSKFIQLKAGNDMTHQTQIQNPAQASSKARFDGQNNMTPKARKIFVTGKTFTFSHDCAEFETMADAGWIFITSVGSENLYFNFKTDSGEILPGYCKCL
jgi:hypothetical protein